MVRIGRFPPVENFVGQLCLEATGFAKPWLFRSILLQGKKTPREKAINLPLSVRKGSWK